MKIYSEEQVRNAIKLARFFEDQIMPDDTIVKKLHSIELPTDEEIEKAFTIGTTQQTQYPHKIEGAKWMRDKIQGGEE